MKKKYWNNRYYSRRQFLIGSSKVVMALPPLISLMPSQVVAQVLNKKVRVITGVSKYGIDPGPRYPDNSLSLITYPGAPHTQYRAFSDMPNNVSRLVDFNDPALAGIASKMNLIRGLNLISETGRFYQGSHGFTVLSGTFSGSESPTYGASIDTIIERKLGVKAMRIKTDSRDKKISGFSFWRPSRGAAFASSSHIFADEKLFNTLFPNGSNSAPQQQAFNIKKFFIDNVLNDLNALMNHRRISQEDRLKLDQYTTSVHEVQRRLVANENQEPVSCSEAQLAFEQGKSSINYNTLFDNYNELIALAMQCDQLRVVHIANSAARSNFAGDSASNSFHHSDNANGDVQADKKKYFLQRMALLAKKLDSLSDPFDPDKTLLDNSIMLWTADLGAWNSSHSVTQIPAITFGSGGGYFQTGYFVDYRFKPLLRIKSSTDSHMYGRPYKQLLISMMRAAGLQPSDYLGFGTGANTFGEFSNYIEESNTDKYAYRIWDNVHNDPLPFLTSGA